MKQNTGKLSVWTKLGFGACDLGGNMFFTALGFWGLNYLTDTVMVPAAAAGLAIMIGKLWDAFTDPMMGYISDRTRTRWGRRKPYIILGAVPLFLSMWWFFTNPGIEDVVLRAVWAGVAISLLNTAYTVVNIPYSSLTPELTKDYHERTSLNGYRFGFAVVGTLIGAGAVLPLVNAFGANRSLGFSVTGLVLGAVMMVSALVTGFSVREPDHSSVPKSTRGFLKTYLSVFKNKPYLFLLFTYTLHMIGVTFLSGIIIYYFKYVYSNEAMAMVALPILLLTAMAFIPVSVLVSKRIGKKLTYQVCFFILATSCLILYFLAHTFGISFFLGMMVYAGIGLGFSYVSPYAMIPDAIDFADESPEDGREGSYYGMWTFMSKSGQAIAIILTGGILSLGNYVPEAVQAPEAIAAIRLLIGPIPAIALVAAMVLVQFYPIDEKKYAEFMAKRNAG